MTSGMTKKMTAQSDKKYHYKYDDFMAHDAVEMDEFHVEFRHVQFILLFYFICMLLSLMIFTCEIFGSRRRNRIYF